MKIKLLILSLFTIGFMACENQDKEYEDYGTTAGYFPHQRPARCLVLGKYDLGFNDNDNNHRFEIGVTMSGVYTNTAARKVHYRLAPELLTGVSNVKILPESYYTIEAESPVTIPVGSIKGRIPVQLNDEFFDDPLAFDMLDSVNYVIPLLITEVEKLDTILSGKALVDNPSRVIATDWEIEPKDYTLYGIKFMNKFQGKYLRRGADVMTNAANETVTSVYSAEYVEKDEVIAVTTTGKNKVELTKNVLRGTLSSQGEVNMELSFDENGNCTVSSFGDDAYNVSGTGKFVEDGDAWGGKVRDVIYLDYSYTDAVENETHSAKDTLVIRNRAVEFEQFDLVLTE